MRHVVHSARSSRETLLASRARQKRFSLNASEELLWRAVAGGRLGVYFRRQVPLLGRFIVDMLAPTLRLVVEVDGGWHARRRRADARRDEALRRAGYHVLRLEAELVMRQQSVAVQRLREAIEGIRP